MYALSVCVLCAYKRRVIFVPMLLTDANTHSGLQMYLLELLDDDELDEDEDDELEDEALHQECACFSIMHVCTYMHDRIAHN
jgi:hypothetical protein